MPHLQALAGSSAWGSEAAQRSHDRSSRRESNHDDDAEAATLAEQLRAALQATSEGAPGRTSDGADDDAEKGVAEASRAVVADSLAEMEIDDASWLSVIDEIKVSTALSESLAPFEEDEETKEWQPTPVSHVPTWQQGGEVEW